MTTDSGSVTHDFYGERPFSSPLFSWIFSTDHKRIGILYLISLSTMFAVGMTLGLIMRIEQFAMGSTIMEPQTYNQAFTLHGVIMIFLFVVPGLPAVFGNFFMPIMIGAKDVAFPRLNLLSWWVYVTGALLAAVALFSGPGFADTGWTFYAPYSTRTGTNVTLAVLAAFILGFSSMLTGINFVTTIQRLRVAGMTWMKMPLFPWSLYVTGWIQILATPIIGITFLLVAAERILNVGIFDPARGGDPLLFQHLFWIYSHPAVYIMILPGMGVISEIIPVFARKSIFGYSAIVYSTIAIGFAGSLVWGHHMFVSGESIVSAVIFSFVTFLVSIPSAIKVFNWVATLYKGSIHLEPPMLYAAAFIFLFTVGGLTGVFQGTLSVDIYLHDTYFVVGHLHYIVFGGTGFSFLAAIHYWYPKMFGRMYDKKRAYVFLALLFIGFNIFYGSMIFLGLAGMPRRYYDHLARFHSLHVVASTGAVIMVAGLVGTISNLLVGIRSTRLDSPDPWECGRTLEWSVPTPPPLLNFSTSPLDGYQRLRERFPEDGA